MNSPMHPLDRQRQASLEGNFELGWQLAQLLERQNPNCHRAAFNRAIYYLMQGDLLKGLEHLDRGRWENVFGDQRLPTTKPIWQNQDLRGKELLLCSEGGLGDEVLNSRFAKDFADKGARVSLTCDPSMMSALSRVEGVSAVIPHKDAPLTYHDFWVPAMSAPRVLEYSYEKLNGSAYLTPDSQFVKKWKSYFNQFSESERPKIGLRFYGNSSFANDDLRRFPAEKLIQVIGDRKWINLQKEETNLPLETWEDTLAVISCLDLVITSCTSIAHASAAMGIQTWVLVPILPYHVWALPGSSTPWYKSVRLFRQKKYKVWDEVFEEIDKALLFIK
jgi:hypothetical protein